MGIPDSLSRAHDAVFRGVSAAFERWLPGLAARLIFASVLLLFFLNSALTKVGSGIPGMFIPASGAYAQMLPPIAEKYSYDVAAIPLFPWKIIVFAGTYLEFLLPVLILIGLFTRLASLGMIGFIATMTFVDIAFHKADAKTIGMVFDRVQDSVIADQRLLWLFPLIYLVIYGAGALSLDALFSRRNRELDI